MLVNSLDVLGKTGDPSPSPRFLDRVAVVDAPVLSSRVPSPDAVGLRRQHGHDAEQKLTPLLGRLLVDQREPLPDQLETSGERTPDATGARS